MKRFFLMCLGGFLATAIPIASQQPDPAAMSAKDSHDGMTVACAPILTEQQYKERFGKKNPQEVGILALEVFLRNDNSEAARVDLDTLRLVVEPRGGSRQRIRALTVEEVVGAIVTHKAPDPTMPRKRLPGPIPVPGAKKDKEAEKVADVLRPLSLEMDVIPPRATIKGFLYFDLGGKFELVRVSRLYIPDVTLQQSRKALLFFEVDLSAAAP